MAIATWQKNKILVFGSLMLNTENLKIRGVLIQSQLEIRFIRNK